MNTATGSDDPRDYLVDQGFANYTDADHETWRTLGRQRRQSCRAGSPISSSMGSTGSGSARPAFRISGASTASSRRRRAGKSWPCRGSSLTSPSSVSLPIANFRRASGSASPSRLDYIEEPDIFHDVFGHVPLITQPLYADYLEAYGKAGLVAAEHGALKRLARLYWYTVEFGLARTPQGLRIVGAGIASSPSETMFALESPSPNRIAFDLGRVMRTLYRIDDFQETYFVLDGVEAWPSLDLARMIPLWHSLGRDDRR